MGDTKFPKGKPFPHNYRIAAREDIHVYHILTCFRLGFLLRLSDTLEPRLVRDRREEPSLPVDQQV